MIELMDIQAAVSNVLKKNGFSVIASEVKEGFKKPACFVDVMPQSVTLQNSFTELVTDSVEISFHPAVETREELVKTANELKNIFLYTPIQIGDRVLSVNEITFDTDKTALLTYFELEYLQETAIDEPMFPKMKNLEERVVTECRGTSKNTD